MPLTPTIEKPGDASTNCDDIAVTAVDSTDQSNASPQASPIRWELDKRVPTVVWNYLPNCSISFECILQIYTAFSKEDVLSLWKSIPKSNFDRSIHQFLYCNSSEVQGRVPNGIVIRFRDICFQRAVFSTEINKNISYIMT